MLRLLAGFDQFSFWLGFIAALLFLWFYRRVAPAAIQGWKSSREQMYQRRERVRIGVEYDYRNDFIRYIQGIHLAAPLFSLNEVLVPPRILAPPPVIYPGEESLPPDSFARIFPYLPDFPEFASSFDAEKLTLPEALSRGANLALIGGPGAGKTTALAHLGTLIASLSPDAARLADLVPFYIHAGNIAQFPENGTDPTAPIADTVWNAGYLSRRTTPRFYNLVATAFQDQRVMILLDGIDEIEPAGVERVRSYLSDLLAVHPGIRIVAAVSPEYYDGLTGLGLIPVVLAGWTREERGAFVRRWGQQWQKSIDANIWERSKSGIEPGMLYNWLNEEITALTPFELTLRTWGVFAGDAAGSRNRDMIAAYVRRMTVGVGEADLALQRIAVQMALTKRPVPPSRAASLWSRGRTEETATEEDLRAEGDPAEGTPSGAAPEAAAMGNELDLESPDLPDEELLPGRVGRGAVSALIAAGILVQRATDTLSFVHPVLCAYYAGCGLASAGAAGGAFGAGGGAAAVAAQPDWWLRQWALHYLAAEIDIAPLLKTIDGPDLQHFGLLASARWLRDIKPKSEGQVVLMRRLVALFQDESRPAALRQAAIAALALSGETAAVTMSARWISSPDPLIRSMCVLVLGFDGDEKHVQACVDALADPAFQVRTAACFALVRIGSKPAIEAVATTMLHGDEDTQRSAAEALSNHHTDGIELLKEAVGMDDLLVRRAAVFGLGRSRTRSAQNAIRGLQLEDSQWIVRNAADQELQKMEMGSQSIPRPLIPLHDLPWLVAFAGETGEGIAPGLMADELLHRALLRGSHEQVLAALEHYKVVGKAEIRADVERLAGKSHPEVQTAAILTLWHLQAQGITAG